VEELNQYLSRKFEFLNKQLTGSHTLLNGANKILNLISTISCFSFNISIGDFQINLFRDFEFPENRCRKSHVLLRELLYPFFRAG